MQIDPIESDLYAPKKSRKPCGRTEKCKNKNGFFYHNFPRDTIEYVWPRAEKKKERPALSTDRYSEVAALKTFFLALSLSKNFLLKDCDFDKFKKKKASDVNLSEASILSKKMWLILLKDRIL